MTEYKLLPLSVSNKEAFTEASREELRVLIALIECGGKFKNTEELSSLSKTSMPRCSSALVLWEEAGVISKADSERVPTITEEFEERLTRGEIREENSESVAKSIRNENLADMIYECAALMSRDSFSTSEIKELTALYTQFALSEEFIVTLAAHLAREGKLTVTKLVNRAIKLAEKEIDTPDALAEYIEATEADSEAEREFRKIFGIYGRALSKTEKEYFKKWSREYGYFTEIVGEAYDIAVSQVNKGHAKYADKLLTRWYEAGARTLAECRDCYEADKRELKEKKENTSRAAQKPAKKPAERYGNFDVHDAFLRALERSYGKEDD